MQRFPEMFPGKEAAPDKEPPSKPPTIESERYLLYLETHGVGKSGQAVARALDLNRSTISRWRSEIIGFKDREKAIRAKHEQQKKLQPTGSSEAALTEADTAINTEGLEGLQVRYLRNLVLLKHRIQACDATGIRWRQVKLWKKESPRFREEFTELWDERMVSNEDALVQKGERGDVSAARTVLGAHDPRYRQKVAFEGKMEHTHSVDREGARQVTAGWLTKFQPQQQPALPPPPEIVEEAELVEAAAGG